MKNIFVRTQTSDAEQTNKGNKQKTTTAIWDGSYSHSHALYECILIIITYQELSLNGDSKEDSRTQQQLLTHSQLCSYTYGFFITHVMQDRFIHNFKNSPPQSY